MGKINEQKLYFKKKAEDENSLLLFTLLTKLPDFWKHIKKAKKNQKITNFQLQYF